MTFNWLSIVLGTLVWIIAESLLYNPMHAWGRFWARESGMDAKMAEQKMTTGDMVFTFGGTALVGLIMSIGLSHTAENARASIMTGFGVNALVATVMLAFLSWLAFYGVGQFVLAAYSGQSRKLIGLHMVNGLVGLLLMGLVLGIFSYNIEKRKELSSLSLKAMKNDEIWNLPLAEPQIPLFFKLSEQSGSHLIKCTYHTNG
jgi:hypothetical protein